MFPELLLKLAMVNGAAVSGAIKQIIDGMKAKREQDDLIGRAPSGHEKVSGGEGRGESELGQEACSNGAAGEVAERVFALPA